MRIVVTGVAGFVGAAVAARLLDYGHEVLGFDNFAAGLYPEDTKRQRLLSLFNHDGFSFVEEDMFSVDWNAVLADADAVVNEAAMPGLRRSWESFDAYVHSNVRALEKLLHGFVANPHVYLVHASTSSIYGEYAVGGEDQLQRPVSPYGVTKLTAELLIRAYLDPRGSRYGILRYFSVYGPGQRPDMAYARFCEALLAGNSFEIRGDGRQTRTNTYIDDVVDATVRAVVQQRSGLICNVSGSEEIELVEALHVLADEVGLTPHLIFCEEQPGDQRRTVGDSSVARTELGWSPSTEVFEGLRLQAKHFLAHGT